MLRASEQIEGLFKEPKSDLHKAGRPLETSFSKVFDQIEKLIYLFQWTIFRGNFRFAAQVSRLRDFLSTRCPLPITNSPTGGCVCCDPGTHADAPSPLRVRS